MCHGDFFSSSPLFATISPSFSLSLTQLSLSRNGGRSNLEPMTGGDWIESAMCDDSLVAEALICLHHSEPPPPPPPPEKSGDASDLKLKWSVRQRRTKAASPSSRKKGDHTRASPTTPLSWSGATSFSGGGGGGSGGAAAVDGFEESSGAVKLSEAVRSKVRSISSYPFWFLFPKQFFENSALLCLCCVFYEYTLRDALPEIAGGRRLATV